MLLKKRERERERLFTQFEITLNIRAQLKGQLTFSLNETRTARRFILHEFARGKRKMEIRPVISLFTQNREKYMP
jgi:hypothetical protein